MRGSASTLAPLLALAVAAPAAAVVVDSEETARFEQAPEQDPGFTHVGRLRGVSAIYIGDGWILTAGHAGFADVTIDGVLYPAVRDSRVDLHMPRKPETPSDLALFRVSPAPDLPPLELQQKPPTRGTFAMLVGYGRGRGEAVPSSRPDDSPSGYRWLASHAKRWGTNRVSALEIDVPGPQGRLTRSFQMDFSRHGTSFESQAAVGDSGGAVFLKGRDGWRLGGVMISIRNDPTQTSQTSLFGNTTHAADLSAYATQIQRVLRGKRKAP